LIALPTVVQVYAAVIAVGLAINLALGLYLILWDPRNPVNRLVSAIQGLVVIWGSTSLIASILETGRVTVAAFYVLQVNALVNYFGSSFVGCAWLHLALIFPRRRALTRHRWLYPLLYGPNTLFYLLRLTNARHELFYRFYLQDGSFVSVRGPLFWGFLALTYSQVILAIWLMGRSAMRIENALQRKQAGILTGATVLVLGGHVVRVIAPHLLPIDPSTLLLTFSGVLYTYGVLRYRLLGLATILNRAVAHTLTWLLLGAAIFSAITLLRPAWRTLPTWQISLITMLGFAVLCAFRARVSDLVDQSLNPGQKAYEQSVREFLAQLTSVVGSDQLLPGVVEFMLETTYATSGAIIVRDQMSGHFELRYSRGLGELDGWTYPANDPFFGYLQTLKQGDVLEMAQVTAHPRYYDIRDLAELRLQEWRAEVCLVLKVQDELMGVMTLGPRAGGRSFGRSDIRLFSQVAHQMAISVYNVLYYDAIVAAQRQLASLNEELERRVWERTRELAQANEELRQAHQQVIQSEKLASVGKLAAGVAHEINNPVGVILGFSQFLQRQIPPDDVCAQPLAAIERESMRCKQIVQNLLDFARMSEPAMLEIDLHQVLESTYQLLEYQLSKGKVEIVRDYAPGLPSIAADPHQLQQVFVNLMLNAYQAMPQGGRLTIQTRVEASQVAIALTDEGIGIPPANLSRVFDPFFTTKEPGQGTGLGLSVSYGIVKQHSGHFDVQSQIGRGSTFTVYLPLDRQKPPVVARPPRSKTNP